MLLPWACRSHREPLAQPLGAKRSSELCRRPRGPPLASQAVHLPPAKRFFFSDFIYVGTPGRLSGGASAFSPGRDPGSRDRVPHRPPRRELLLCLGLCLPLSLSLSLFLTKIYGARIVNICIKLQWTPIQKAERCNPNEEKKVVNVENVEFTSRLRNFVRSEAKSVSSGLE